VDYKISIHGNDLLNDGISAPWATLTRACGSVASPQPGDRLVFVDEGPHTLSSSGSCDLPFYSWYCNDTALNPGSSCIITVSGSGAISFPVGPVGKRVLIENFIFVRTTPTAPVNPLFTPQTDFTLSNSRIFANNVVGFQLVGPVNVLLRNSTITVSNSITSPFITVPSSASLNIEQTTFVNGTWSNALIDTQGSLSITGSNFFNNAGNSTINALLIRSRDSPLSIVQNLFEFNKAQSQSSPLIRAQASTNLEVVDNMFRGNIFASTSLDSVLQVYRTDNYVISENGFLENSGQGCVALKIEDSTGSVERNIFSDNSMNAGDPSGSSPAQSAVCIYRDYSAVDGSRTADQATNRLRGNQFTGNHFEQASLLPLKSFMNRLYPALSESLYTIRSQLLIEQNSWETSGSESVSRPGLRFDSSNITIQADLPGGSETNLPGVIDNGSEYNLGTQLILPVLISEGVGATLSRFNLAGFNVTIDSLSFYSGEQSSVISGGQFVNGHVVVRGNDFFICCGYLESTSTVGDRLEFIDSSLTTESIAYFARTTTPLAMLGSNKKALYVSNQFHATRLISPYLTTGLTPATINGDLHLLPGGHMLVADMRITGNLVGASGATGVELIPTQFRGVTHGLVVDGSINLPGGLTFGPSLSVDYPVFPLFDPFVPTGNLSGPSYTVLRSSGTSNTWASLDGVEYPVRFEPDIDTSMLVTAKMTGFSLSAVLDPTGSAFFIDFPIDVRGEVTIGNDCSNLIDRPYYASPSDGIDIATLNCKYVSPTRVRVSSSVIPQEGDTIRVDTAYWPFMSEGTDMQLQMPGVNSTISLEAQAVIRTIPTPFYGDFLVLDGSQSTHLGKYGAEYYWDLVHTTATSHAALDIFLSNADPSSPILSIPSSYLENLQDYEFRLNLESTWTGSSPSATTPTIFTNLTACGVHGLRIKGGYLRTIYEQQPFELVAEIVETCNPPWDVNEYAWTFYDENSSPTTFTSFTPILQASIEARFITLHFGNIYRMEVVAKHSGGESEPSQISFVFAPNPNQAYVNSPSEFFIGESIEVRVAVFGRNALVGSVPSTSARFSVAKCPFDTKPEWESMLFPDPVPASSGGDRTNWCFNATGHPYRVRFAYQELPSKRERDLHARLLAERRNKQKTIYKSKKDTLDTQDVWDFFHEDEIMPSPDLEFGTYVIACDITYSDGTPSIRVEWPIEYKPIPEPLGQPRVQIYRRYEENMFWFSPSSRLILDATLNGQTCPQCIFKWSFPNGELQLTPEQEIEPTLAIPYDSLTLGSSIVARVEMTGSAEQVAEKRSSKVAYAGATGYAEQSISVGQVPFGGSFYVEPSSGIAGSSPAFDGATHFTLVASEWAGYYPTFKYYFAQIHPDGISGEIPLAGPSSDNVLRNVTIPASCANGELVCESTIVLRVFDATGAYASTNFTLNLTSNSAPLPAESDILAWAHDVESFLDDNNAIASISIVNRIQETLPKVQLSSETLPSIADIMGRYFRDFSYQLTVDAIYSNMLGEMTLRFARTQLLSYDDFVYSLVYGVQASYLLSSEQEFGPNANAEAGNAFEALLETINIILTRIAASPSGTFNFGGDGPTDPADLFFDITQGLLYSSYIGEPAVTFSRDTFAYLAQKVRIGKRQDPPVRSYIELNAGTPTTVAFSTSALFVQDAIDDEGNLGVSLTVYSNSTFPVPPPIDWSGEVFSVTIGNVEDAEPMRRRSNERYSSKRAELSSVKPADIKHLSKEDARIAALESLKMRRDPVRYRSAMDQRRAFRVFSSSTPSLKRAPGRVVNVNYTTTVLEGGGTPNCAVYDTLERRWVTDTCSTRVSGGGTVGCNCDVQESRADMTVLFGSINGPTNAAGRGVAGNRKLSGGAIAAIVVVILVVLIVAAVVLVNIFVPSLACTRNRFNVGKKAPSNEVGMKNMQ
jgi:hypothetical protein